MLSLAFVYFFISVFYINPLQKLLPSSSASIYQFIYLLICHYLLFCLVLLNTNGDDERVSHVVIYICFSEVDCLDPRYAECLNAAASTSGAFVA